MQSPRLLTPLKSVSRSNQLNAGSDPREEKSYGFNNEIAQGSTSLSLSSSSQAAKIHNVTQEKNSSPGLEEYQKGRQLLRKPSQKLQSIRLFEQAAKKGYMAANLYLFILISHEQNKAEYENIVSKNIDWFLKQAEQYSSNAMCNVGYCYQYGLGFEKDSHQAQIWFKCAALQGDAHAQYELGLIYLKKIDEHPEAEHYVEQSLDWLLKAANQGHVHSQSALSRYYSYTVKVSIKDYNSSNFWRKKAAENGDAKAQGMLGFNNWINDSMTIPQNLYKSFHLSLASAKQGDAMGQLALSQFYTRLADIPDFRDSFLRNKEIYLSENKDINNQAHSADYPDPIIGDKDSYIKTAKDLLRLSALQGNIVGQYVLAYSEKSPIKQFKWFLHLAKMKKPVNESSLPFRFLLAQFYEEGIVDEEGNVLVPKDSQKALEMYRQAGEGGVLDAKSHLANFFMMQEANFFMRQEANPINNVQVFYWSYEASMNNKTIPAMVINKDSLSQAQCILAQCYCDGIGTPINKEQALHWYTQSAINGDLTAAYKLYLFYSGGKECGVSQDFHKAFDWLEKAAKLGNNDARKAFVEVKSKSGFLKKGLIVPDYFIMQLKAFIEWEARKQKPQS